MLDHVFTAKGSEAHISMRAIANGSGCEVLFTMFQTPGMTDEQFRSDADMVMRDLQSLKSVLEQNGT